MLCRAQVQVFSVSRLAQLDDTSSRFAFALEAIGGLLYDWNVQTDAVWRSSGLAEILGYLPEEVPSDREWWTSRIHPEDRSSFEIIITAAVSERRELLECRYRALHRDGKWRYVWDRSRLIYGPSGTLERIVGHTLDVTAEQEARDAADLAEKLVQKTLANSGVMAYLLDRDLRFRWVANAHPYFPATSVIGVLEDQLPQFEVLRPLAEKKRKVLESGEPLELTYSFDLNDGAGERFSKICIDPYRDRSGEVEGVLVTGIDITDVVRQSQSLKETDAMLRIALESAQMGTWQLHPQNLNFDISESTSKILGASIPTRSKTIERFLARIQEPFRAEVEFQLLHALSQNTKVSIEFLTKPEDGEPRWVYMRGEFALDENGNPYLVGAIIDITDQKTLEAELEKRRIETSAYAEEISKILDSVPALILIAHDSEASRITASKWGYEALRLGIGTNVSSSAISFPRHYKIYHRGQEITGHTAAMQTSARENRAINDFDFDVVFNDGTRKSFIGNTIPLRNPDGTSRGSVGAFVEVTAIEAVSRDLRASEQKFLALAEASPSFIWTTDGSGKFTYISSNWRVLSNLPLATADDQVWSLVHPDDRQTAPDRLRAAISAELPYAIVIRLVDRTGDYRWYELRAAPQRDSTEKIVGWSGLTIDVHDRVERELELETRVNERTAALQAANLEMEGFTYSIAHDLRAPLRAISSYAKILSDECADILTQEHRRILLRQEVNAKKLAQLIDDLLRYSRIGRLDLERRTIDLTELCHEVIRSTYSENVTFTVQESLYTVGDPSLVRLLLENLFDNAVKYSPNGGLISFGCEEGAFVVSDQGIGFDTRYAEQIFKPFERLHRDDAYPGTGIGLANVKRIVERHEGKVWVESNLNRGSRFYFTLGPDSVLIRSDF